MPVTFNLPDLGENIQTGAVVSVLVREGDVVGVGQGVIEIETDKAVAEVPCSHAGRITKMHVSQGDMVRVGAPVLTLETAAGATTATPPESEARTTAHRAVAHPPFTPRRQEPIPIAAGPSLRRLARELGVDLGELKGTGGRVTRADVEAAAKAKAAAPGAAPAGAAEHDKWGPIRREPLTQIRKTIAAQMVRSATTIPHVTHCDDADVTDLEAVRRTARFDDLDPPVKVTLLPFILKALAFTLKQHPTFNASFDAENGQIIYKDYVSVGIAVDTDRGLIVPVIRDVDRMDILEIAQAAMEAADKVRSGRFDLETLRGGTFTVSNVGAYGGTYSTPIINHPEVAVLLVGRTRRLPMYHDGAIEPRLMLPLSLSYDHRLLDGAMAARFMRDLIGYLNSPGRLLLSQD